MTYFADTSFWIVFHFEFDQYHRRAVAWSRHLSSSNVRILTTEAVLWELLNAFGDSDTQQTAVSGYRRCRKDSRVEVVGFAPVLISATVDLYEARPDKDWSLTDGLSFVVMKQRRISQALTADQHFVQAGFEALLLEDPPRA